MASDPENAFGPTKSLMFAFAALKDPRIDRQKRHKLLDVIIIAVCSIVCGGRTWEDVEYFGEAYEEWLRSFLELANGIPSHDTFRRVFMLIDATAFARCFTAWVTAISGTLEGKLVGIDGKTLRGSLESGASPLHLVNAWCHDNKTVLAQYAVDEKSNEITALPKILEMLSLKGCIITTDALHTQRNTAELIIAKEADYLMQLKGNQKSLHDDVTLAFDGTTAERLDARLGPRHTSVDNDHGRIDERSYWLTSDIAWLQASHQWPGLKALGIAETKSEKAGNITVDRRYYLLSFEPSVERFAQAVRGHWSVEAMHWTLDQTFGEDASRMRRDNSPQNFSMMRKIAMNLLRSTPLELNGKIFKRASIAGKMRVAGWDTNFMLKVLFGKKN